MMRETKLRKALLGACADTLRDIAVEREMGKMIPVEMVMAAQRATNAAVRIAMEAAADIADGHGEDGCRAASEIRLIAARLEQ